MAPYGEIRSHRAAPWSSITFSGARHTLQVHFEGAEAVDHGIDLLTTLPDHDFDIPGSLVADVAITQSDWHNGPTVTLSAAIDVLILDEAA